MTAARSTDWVCPDACGSSFACHDQEYPAQGTARVCAAYLSLSGNQPDRGVVHAGIWSYRCRGEGRQTGALTAAQRTDAVSRADTGLVRQIGTEDLAQRGMEKRISVAERTCTDLWFLL